MHRRKDAFYQRAKASGYRSRAAYKLLELDRTYRLLRRGDRVLDLGAWPGGWLQIAAEAVGSGGIVVGVDLTPIEPLPQAWVRTVFGDAANENVQEEIAAALGGEADIFLSDMAPKLSGVRDRDEVRSADLVRLAAAVAAQLLRPGGRMVVKMFTSSATRGLLEELKTDFAQVRTTRPEATRKGSSEMYAIATGYRRGKKSAL